VIVAEARGQLEEPRGERSSAVGSRYQKTGETVT
jgi:hypothetical protein